MRFTCFLGLFLLITSLSAAETEETHITARNVFLPAKEIPTQQKPGSHNSFGIKMNPEVEAGQKKIKEKKIKLEKAKAKAQKKADKKAGKLPPEPKKNFTHRDDLKEKSNK